MSDTYSSQAPPAAPATSWHLTKSVPITLIVGLALNALTLAYFAGQHSVRLDLVEKRTDAGAQQAERIAKIETRTETLVASMNRVEALLLQRSAATR